MRRERFSAWRTGMNCLALLVLVCLVGGAPSHSAQPATGTEAEIAELSKKILANPLDSAARTRLLTLRRQQQDERAKALDALVGGLGAYKDGNSAAAGRDLGQAAQCPYVVALANAVLVRPLDVLIRECGRPGGPGASACPQCGGLGWITCAAPACLGSGVVQCTKCQGKGSTATTTVDRARTTLTISTRGCGTCSGTGAVECKACKGKGELPCPKCSAASSSSGKATKPGDAQEAEAISKLIDIASYIRSGGADLSSPQALKCSPKVAAPAAAPAPGPAPAPAAAPAPAPATPAAPSGTAPATGP